MQTQKREPVIPDSYDDLLASTTVAHIATIGPHGEPQNNPVWFGWDDQYLKFSQTKARQKYRNIGRDPRIAVSIVDPENHLRYLEVRGEVVRIDEDPNLDFINEMADKYLGLEKYPYHQPGDERVVIFIEPRHLHELEPSALAPGVKSAKGSAGVLRRALAYLHSYKKEAVGAFLVLLLVSAANLATPQLIAYAVDRGVTPPGSLRAILLAVGGLVGVAVLRGAFQFLQGYLAEKASQGVAYDLRNALFEKIERLGFGYYDRQETGQLVTRLTSDVEQIRTFAGSGVVQLASAAVMLLGTTVLLLFLDLQLALVTLATVSAIFVLLLWFVRRIGPLFRGVQQALGRLNTVLQEDLSGVKTIRAYAREDYETARYREVNDDLLKRNLETVRTFSNNFPFVFFVANLGTLGIVLFGGLRVIGGSLSVGELIAFNTYLGFLLFPILTIGFLSAAFSRAGASAARVFEILDASIEVEDKPDAVSLPPIRCRVEFDDVRFRYPGGEKEILKG